MRSLRNQALAHSLGMSELVNELDLLYKITRHVAGNLAKVVLAELLADPKAHILVAGRELGVRGELSVEDT